MDNALLEKDIEAIKTAGGSDQDILNYLKEQGVNYNETPEQTIQKSQPQSLIQSLLSRTKGMASQETGIVNKLGAISRGVQETLMPQSPEQGIAEAKNTYAISETTGIDRKQLLANNKTLLKQLLRNPDVTGINPDLSNQQFTAMTVAPAIALGLATNPIGMMANLAAYGLVDKLIPQEKFISQNIDETARTALEITDFLAKGKISHIGVNATTDALSWATQKVGKDKLAQAIHFFTKTVSPQAAARAIERPELLSPSALAKEGAEAGADYKKVVQPLRNDPTTRVDLKPIQQRLEAENVMVQGTKRLEPSSEFYKMTNVEQGKVQGWMKKIQVFTKGKVDVTYNDAESMLFELDRELGKFYTKKSSAQVTGIEPTTTSFQRMTNIIRGSLSDVLKSQFPETAPVVERYHNYLIDKSVANAFKGINASFFKGLPMKVAAVSLLGIGAGQAAIPAYLSTMPAFWKKLIRGASGAAKQIKAFPKPMVAGFGHLPSLQSPEE